MSAGLVPSDVSLLASLLSLGPNLFFFFFFFLINLFIFIFGCVGSSLLRTGFL